MAGINGNLTLHGGNKHNRFKHCSDLFLWSSDYSFTTYTTRLSGVFPVNVSVLFAYRGVSLYVARK